MVRGIEKKKIFCDDQDRKDFVSRLRNLSKQTGTRDGRNGRRPHIHVIGGKEQDFFLLRIIDSKVGKNLIACGGKAGPDFFLKDS